MHDAEQRVTMRTRLAIDDDVLTAAKAIAHQTNRTSGDVVSDLARRPPRSPAAAGERNGVPRSLCACRASSSLPRSSTRRAMHPHRRRGNDKAKHFSGLKGNAFIPARNN